MSDAADIRGVVENWAIWRDTGQWDRLLGAWHADGRIVTTWFQGSAQEFVEHSRRAWQAGAMVHHVLGGFSIDIIRHRAIAQTRVILCARATVDGILCDAACTGRFYDFFEKRDGRWGIVLRQPIYEKDRLDPVDPGARLHLDATILDRFPAGYRHLAYLQTRNGQTVAPNLPGLRGPEVDRLHAGGQEWLQGGDLWDPRKTVDLRETDA